MTNHKASIDIIKGLSILFVVLLHTFSNQALLAMGSIFYIGQAVPVFIIIAGHNTTLSLISKGITKISSAYKSVINGRRLARLLGPFFIVYAIELMANLLWGSQSLSAGQVLIQLLAGGWGPGSYYIPITLQYLIIVPLLYFLALRNPDRMLAFGIILSIALEFLSAFFNMPDPVYRLLYIRYLFTGALGIWLVMSKKEIKRPWLAFGTIASLIYISIVEYFGWRFPLIQPSWGSQNYPGAVYPFCLVLIGLTVLPRNGTNRAIRVLEKIGQASWHIFLVQMVYFWSHIGSKSAGIIGMPNFLMPLLNLLICVLLGYLFYVLWGYISSFATKIFESKAASMRFRSGV